MSDPKKEMTVDDIINDLEAEFAGLGAWFDKEVEEAKNSIDSCMPGGDVELVKVQEKGYQAVLEVRKDIDTAELNCAKLRSKVKKLQDKIDSSYSDEALAKQVVDAGQLHLADESTIFQLEKIKKDLEIMGENQAEAIGNVQKANLQILRERDAARTHVKKLAVLAWAGIDCSQQLARLGSICKGMLLVEPTPEKRAQVVATLGKAILNWRGWDALARSAPFLPPHPPRPNGKEVKP